MEETYQGIIPQLSQPEALWERICAVSGHPCLFLSGTISSGLAIPEINPGDISVLQIQAIGQLIHEEEVDTGNYILEKGG